MPRSLLLKKRRSLNAICLIRRDKIPPFFHWPPPFSLTRLDLIAWTQVHAINAVLIRSDARQAATSPAIGKYCVGHSPTRKKNRELTRLNRGTDSPINYRHYLLYYLPYAWRPHGHPRVLALPRGPSPRGRAVRLLRSTCATSGLLCGLWAELPPRDGPLATCRVDGLSARHVSSAVSLPLFFRFF